MALAVMSQRGVVNLLIEAEWRIDGFINYLNAAPFPLSRKR